MIKFVIIPIYRSDQFNEDYTVARIIWNWKLRKSQPTGHWELLLLIWFDALTLLFCSSVLKKNENTKKLLLFVMECVAALESQ